MPPWGDEALAPDVGVSVDDNLDLCPGHRHGSGCLRVRWGSENQFQAAPFLSEEGLVPWPRGAGLPLSFSFIAPSAVAQAMLEFGENLILLELRDMTRETPHYHYRLHYPELSTGLSLYDSNKKNCDTARCAPGSGQGQCQAGLQGSQRQ